MNQDRKIRNKRTQNVGFLKKKIESKKTCKQIEWDMDPKIGEIIFYTAYLKNLRQSAE